MLKFVLWTRTCIKEPPGSIAIGLIVTICFQFDVLGVSLEFLDPMTDPLAIGIYIAETTSFSFPVCL